MSLHFWAHAGACLTKQALGELMQDLMAASEVKVGRAFASPAAPC